MKHPLLLILDADEFRTKELERALQLKGWSARWIGSADGPAVTEEGHAPSALVVNSGRGSASIRSIRAFRNKDPFIPLILIGENAMSFPMVVDAYIPHGATPDAWLAAITPFWPSAVQSQAQQEETGEIFSKYKLVRKIASGGMADIYQAEQMEPSGFNRVLVIKRLLPRRQQNPVFVKALLDEANLAVLLDHQNIARVFDFGVELGACYIAMEYVDGGSLRALIDKAKELGITFPEPIAAFLIAQAAGALDYFHRRRDADGQALNLVHRDISPQNILVNMEGAVKLIDFGIAKAANSAPDQTAETTLHGKLLYMSPEQSLGSSIDHRSDIYSLGLVLFEMLTTEHCFKADDEFGLLEKIRGGIVRDIKKVKPGVSKPMARILGKTLQKNLSDRYGSAHKMALDLKSYLDHLKLNSLESDVIAFVKMLHDVHPQTRAFVESRFSHIHSDTVLPSENINTSAPDERGGEAMVTRPAWILPTISILATLLAYLFWISINA